MRHVVLLLSFTLLSLSDAFAAPVDGSALAQRADSLLRQYGAAQSPALYSAPHESGTPSHFLIDTPLTGAEALLACTMPGTAVDRNGGRHPFCWRGRDQVIWGRANGGALPYQWTWDFGDGSPPATGTAGSSAEANNIQATHAYGTQGSFVARLSVNDANGTTASSEVVIDVAADVQQVRIDAAVEDGLRALYLRQASDGSWDGNGDYGVAGTAGALVALQLRGHLAGSDPCADAYQRTVKAGLDYLLSQVVHYPLPAGDYPDVNGDGRGVYFSGALTYAHGLAMMALATAQDLDYVATGGQAVGQTVRQILQNAVEQCYEAQAKPNSGNYRGGWRYSMARSGDYADADNSAVQWAVLGLEAAGEAGIPIDPQVKEELAYWIAYSQDGSGGFGYSGVSSWNNVAKTASGMISLHFMGADASDPHVQLAVGFLNQHWGDGTDNSGYAEQFNGNSYALYSLAKSCRSLRDPATGLPISMIGTHDWYSEYVNHLLYNGSWGQRSDGSWVAGPWTGSTALTTAFAILTLNPEAVVDCRPVARATASPGAVSCPGAPVRFDGSASGHQCADRQIVEWLWDFDDSDADGVNFDVPDATGPIAVNQAGYALPGSQTTHTYYAILRVKDDSSPPKTSTVRIPVVVNTLNNPPIACLHADCSTAPYSGPVGEPIHFDASGSFDPDACRGDAISAYAWDLDGDGQYDDGNGATAEYTWDTPHYGQVGLRVYDSSGTPSTGQVYVSVYASDRNLSITSSDIVFIPPCQGCVFDHLTIRARVKFETVGGVTVTLPGANVEFFAGDPASGGTFIGEQPIPTTTSAGTVFEVDQPWDIPGSPYDAHPIYVVVDRQNKVFESDENDNQASRDFRLAQAAFVGQPCTSTQAYGQDYWLVGTIHRVKWEVLGEAGTAPDRLVLQLGAEPQSPVEEIAYSTAGATHNADGTYEMSLIVPKGRVPAGQSLVPARLVLDGGGYRSQPTAEFRVQEIKDYAAEQVPAGEPSGTVAGVVLIGDAGKIVGPAHGMVSFLWTEDTWKDVVLNLDECKRRRVSCRAHVDIGCDGFFLYRPGRQIASACIRPDDRIAQVSYIPNSIDPDHPIGIMGAWEVDFTAGAIQGPAHVQYVVVDHSRQTVIWDPFNDCGLDDICDYEPPATVHGASVVLSEPQTQFSPDRSAEHPLVLVNGWTEHINSYALMTGMFAVSNRITSPSERIHRRAWLLNYSGFQTPASDAGLMVSYGLEMLLRRLLIGGSASGVGSPTASASADIVAHSYGAMATRAYAQGLTGTRDARSSDYSHGAVAYHDDIHRFVMLTPVNNGSHEANRVIDSSVSYNTWVSQNFKCTRRNDPMPEDMGIGSAFQWALNGPNATRLTSRVPASHCLVVASSLMNSLLASALVGYKWECPQADGPVSLPSASLLRDGVPLLETNLADHSGTQTTISPAFVQAIDLFLSQDEDHLAESVLANDLVQALSPPSVPNVAASYRSTSVQAGTSSARLPEGAVAFRLPHGTSAFSDDIRLVSQTIVPVYDWAGNLKGGWIEGKGYQYDEEWTYPDWPTYQLDTFHSWGWQSYENTKNGKPTGKHKRIDLRVWVDKDGQPDLRSMASDEDMALPTLRTPVVYTVRINNKPSGEIPVERASFRYWDLSNGPRDGFLAASPVNVRVEDPQGRYVDSTTSTIPDAAYIRIPDEDGTYHTFVSVPRIEGQYKVTVTPAAEAQPSDTYSLFGYNAGIAETLAVDQPIASIPVTPYTAVFHEPPAPPTGVEAISGATTMRIRWQSASGDRVHHYRVYYGITNERDDYSSDLAAEGASPIDVPPGHTELALSCLPDSSFQVRVVSVDPEGRESEYSNKVTAIPLRLASTVNLKPERLKIGARRKYVRCAITLQPPASVTSVDRSSIRLGGTIAPVPGATVAMGMYRLQTRFDRQDVMKMFPGVGMHVMEVTCHYVGCKDTVTVAGTDSMRFVMPRIKHPCPGERVVAGADYRVEWDVPGGVSADSFVVSLSKDRGDTWTALRSVVGGARTLTWHTPAASRDSVYILIEAFSRGDYAGEVMSAGFVIGQAALGVGDEGAIPANVFLSPPRPTPFQSSTTIQYGLPRLSQVRIEVFDVNGRLIKTLVDGTEAPGNRSVRWDGSTDRNTRVGTGIYMIRMEVGDEVKVQRAVLLR